SVKASLENKDFKSNAAIYSDPGGDSLSGRDAVWSGHKDGKVRSWKMDQQPADDTPFKEGLSW
ncbi:hypothetical protein Tco_0233204, partial [Tanacetum coccineum]